MDFETKFQQLISGIAPTLKSNGYKKSHSNFYIRADENWGVINFQKSLRNTADQKFFTINLGVASAKLLRFFEKEYSRNGPSVWDCHWHTRLGELIGGKDMWWSIDATTSIEETNRYFLKIFTDLAFPEIKRYLDDNELRDLWLSGKSPNLTEFQRLLHLCALLKEIGPQELLEPTVRKLTQISAGKTTSFIAEFYIEKLLMKPKSETN